MTNTPDPVHAFVNGYEFRFDCGGGHIPDENERAMLEDAINGYLATLTPPQPSKEDVKRVANEIARSVTASVATCLDSWQYEDIARTNLFAALTRPPVEPIQEGDDYDGERLQQISRATVDSDIASFREAADLAAPSSPVEPSLQARDIVERLSFYVDDDDPPILDSDEIMIEAGLIRQAAKALSLPALSGQLKEEEQLRIIAGILGPAYGSMPAHVIFDALKARGLCIAPTALSGRDEIRTRRCTVCKATVAEFPQAMCCHCQEVPWPIEDH